MKTRLDTLAELGRRLREGGVPDAVAEKSLRENAWFTREGIRQAVRAVAEDLLDADALAAWLAPYAPFPDRPPRTVGVVMAGNIPLVGWFDLMTVIACGHTCLVRPSSKDRALTEWLTSELKRIDPSVPVRPWTDRQVPEAVIATGSDNTNRYFRSRFAGLPAVMRGSRTSVAVLSGKETEAELDGLWNDIFSYFGLGCRNVTRLLLPEGYPPESLAERFRRHAGAFAPEGREPAFRRYRHAYLYNKALHRMRGETFLDGDYFTLTGAGTAAPTLPLSEVGYLHYRSLREANAWIARREDTFQCIVSTVMDHPRTVPFGKAQRPALTDYPDGKDTVRFLLDL